MTSRANQHDQIDIDAIVRLVVERVLSATSAAQTAPSAPRTMPHSPILTQAESEPSIDEASSLTIAERVVTLELLRGRLAGIRSLQVQRGAVVTPAVIDELRDRDIALCRVEAANGQTASSTCRLPLTILATAASSSQSTAKTIGRLLQFANVDTRPVQVEQLRQRLTQLATHELLIVSDVPHETLWEVHQLKVRAMLCRTSSDIREAKNNFRAKVIVIDGRSGLSTDVVDALREPA